MTPVDQEPTRRSLLEQVRDLDDQRAWEAFDERYRELILRYCRRRGVDPTDAEDVRQIVMMKLARSMPRFEYRPEVGRFREYLGRLVANAIYNRWRRRGSDELAHAAGPEELDGVADELDDAWDREWMLHHYRHAFERVKESFEPRTLAVFRGVLDGRSTDELAREHSMRRDAIYKLKQRVRDRLREAVELQLQEEEFPERRT